MLNRQRVLGFISLLHEDPLGMTKEQIKMADNYFTILNNEVPEIWFDQGIELGGGQPFTIGHEGTERNRMHIVSRSLSNEGFGVLHGAGECVSLPGRNCSTPVLCYNVELHSDGQCGSCEDWW